jgi:pilus assembly protein CpaB
MSGRSGIILILAILCGLGAMFGARQLLTRKEAPVELCDVVVAARDLKIDEVLREDMLKVVQRPKSQVPLGTFATAQELVGRWVQIAMLADEPILTPKLAPKDTPPGLIGRIPSGMRALAVEVNEQTGVSGFVLPDHRVDIVQARDDPNDGGRKAVTILRNVQVLAAGQATARPEDRSIQVRTVTLALTPSQVETLVSARAHGSLSLALRGFGATDEEPIEVAEAEPTPPPAPAPTPAPPPEPEPRPEPAPAVAPPPPAHYTLIYRGFGPPEKTPRVGGPRVAGPCVRPMLSRNN